MNIKDFLYADVIYDKESQTLFSGTDKTGLQVVADVRAWGAIQNLFMDKNGKVDFDKASSFQDELGQFIADAISEKLLKSE